MEEGITYKAFVASGLCALQSEGTSVCFWPLKPVKGVQYMAAIALAATGAALLPMLQARKYHRESIDTLRRLKEKEISQSKLLHEDAMGHAASLEKASISTYFDTQHEYISLQLELSRRETMRDVWLQRDLLNRTILIMVVLMFSSTYESLSQATIPEATASWLLYAYGISLASAQTTLIIGMWICIRIQRMSAGFDQSDRKAVYRCGKRHQDFNSYWDCHCESMRKLSSIFFWVGAGFAVLALCSIEVAKFVHLYDDITSAVLFMAPLLAGLAVTLVLPCVVSEGRVQKLGDYGGLTGITEMSRERVTGIRANMSP